MTDDPDKPLHSQFAHLPGWVVGMHNRELVREYMLGHVGATNREAGEALGLSAWAVGRHIQTLRKEWLTPKEPDAQ